MAEYMIRVVLHGASSQQYEQLHSAMAAIGAKRTIRGDDGVLYDLPDGEYDLSSSAMLYNVREAAYAAACSAKAKPDPSVLVTQGDARSWRLRPVPGQS